MAPGPPRIPRPGRPYRGNHGGRGGDGAGRTHPLPPTPLQTWGGGEGGKREGASRGRRKSGLEEDWGLCREGGAGPSCRAGRGEFPEPCRCGAQGPDVQRRGEGWYGRLGRDAAASPAPSPASRVGVGSRPGQGADSPSHWRCVGLGQTASRITGRAAARPLGGASGPSSALSRFSCPRPGSRLLPLPLLQALPRSHSTSPAPPPPLRSLGSPAPGSPSFPHLGLGLRSSGAGVKPTAGSACLPGRPSASAEERCGGWGFGLYEDVLGWDCA